MFCIQNDTVLALVGSCVNLFHFCLQVDAPCRIERAKDPLLQDYVFSCDVSHSVVPAKGKLVLCIRFQPRTVGEHSTDYFTVISAGCLQQTVLKVVGSCKGITVKSFHVPLRLPLSPEGKGLMPGEGLSQPSVIDLPSAAIQAVPGALFEVYICLRQMESCWK